MKAFLCFLFVVGGALTGVIVKAEDKVIVHEWGTFTSLQDENGKAIGGINVDDEPAPYFVYTSGGIPVLPAAPSFASLRLPPYGEVQEEGRPLPFGDPSVTLRLETPVLYLYPPVGKASASVPSLKVHVDFNGGILGQYYPYARFKGPPLQKGKLTDQTVTSLDWKILRLGVTQPPVTTNDKVWTTPREVSAPLLEVKAPSWSQVKGGSGMETEKFLFYRGLGHLDSPLRLQDGDGNLGVWPQQAADGGEYSHVWLTEIHADGSCAFRAMGPMAKTGAESRPRPLAILSERFETKDFSADNLRALQASMQDALVKEGLYPDEASAMLRTWELSYFKSPGLRFFYIVPRAWTDQVLPLKITGAPTEITRVMVGRIELINEQQKAALARFAVGPCPDLGAVKKAALEVLKKGNLSKEEVDAFYRGEKPLTELGIEIPPLMQDYLNLGRFRDALIVHEQALHPTPALAQFIARNNLKP